MMNAIPIAEGRTAEIYTWDDHHILKLYRDWCPPHWVDYESRIAHAIHAAGIPTPAAGEIIEIEGRRGLIYERIDGISILQDMNAHPWTILKHARTLAELQVEISRKSIPGLPAYKGQLQDAIQKTRYLTEDLRNKCLNVLESLPNGQTVCHGDYHPHNVLLTSSGPLVIDWMTACSGSPWADVARTSLLLTIGPKGAGKQVSPLIRTAIWLYHRRYLSCYLALTPDRNNELKRWSPIIAAARLNEDIAPEREALLKLVQKDSPCEPFQGRN
jgi:Ser/Thr protein kinase RdoA (MazF antagonist)